jgi:hypothetical protein
MDGVTAFTVRVAALLVTVLAGFETIHRNCAPLSDNVADGVV